ncbi:MULTISPECIES: alpha/beta fold hydrolase [Streptomyces]|uniref:Alpha/beta fold hydrolase n=1 Tax=Streptomyces solicathayae TaxID=3081768 RepID=A0ABZ0LPS7_9ACTN|nr:alpha/beta fold hydrolase [Streptomyces sp. HUAS YS2]WOX21505.1 alpha/beta fold hydrolase [Streptomyces sp. HUAS YS2]
MPIVTNDLLVPHKSTVPANKNDPVELFVRERDGTPLGLLPERKAVLMLHGRSIPALAAFDLQHTSYSWAEHLAKAGYDVFMMDLQGSGRSPRPKMNEPRNASPANQNLLTPRPPGFTPGPVEYKFQLNNSNSDRDELHTVVEYIRKERNVDKVAFVGYSAAGLTMGPYAVNNPTRVESLFLLAPVFPPDGTSTPPSTLPQPGFPMFLGTRWGLEQGWNRELGCDGQRELGIVEKAWAAVMESDPVGRNWGPPEGLNRIRNFVRWGWNKTTAAQGGVLGGRVPVLIVYGEHDATVNTSPPSTDPELNFSVPALYDAITGDHKLMVKLACAGHTVVWETQHKNVHNLSKHWLKHLKVDGKTQGVFNMDTDGNLSPA